MPWRPTIYAVPPLLSTLASTVLLWVAWRNRDRTVARPFAVLMAGLAAWSLTYAVQLGVPTLSGQLFWMRLSVATSAFVPPAWVVLTVVYAGREPLVTRRRVLALLVEPVAFAALIATNGVHGLVWPSMMLDRAAAIPVVDVQFGPAYLVHLGYGYLLVLAGIFVLTGVLVRASTIYRRQAALLVVGATVPLGANVAFVAGLNPIPELDFTTATFTLTGLVFGLALFRFDLLNLTPVARRRVVEEFGGGLVVVDEDGRVVQYDGIVEQVLPELAGVGDDLAAVLEVDALSEADGRVLTADVEGRTRSYQVAVSRLADYRDETVGGMVALQDITDRREYEQRLEVANRLLRHNLRNDMTKIIGLADLVAARSDDDVAEDAERIATVADDVAELGRKARQIEATLEAGRADTRPVDPAAVIESVVEDAREEWPAATVETSVADVPAVAAPGEDLLRSALANVVENAIEHSDRDAPTVEIRVDRTGDGVTVRVADDGPGLPDIERQAFERGHESALTHSSGLGLWLAHWVASACGGRLAFEENEPRGTVVVFHLVTHDRAAADAVAGEATSGS